MILLNGHSLTPKQIFPPESMSLTLTENAISTASMTLGPDAPEIKIDDWLLDNVEPGEGIVWRVKALDTVYETQTRTVQLEHVLATLRDALLFGEITTKTLAGSNASNVSAERALRYVLGRQSIWRLGDFEFSRSLPYSFNNQSVYNALDTICGTLDGWRWEYDLSALPFKLHIRRQRSNLGGELRMGRNLITLKKTVDRSSMYTRFYPVGARNMHISGNYVSRNEDIYGVVSKTETNQSITKKSILRAWAEDRLSRHCEPNVTVTISALELAEATGEALDRFTLGYPCRVPLPEYNTTILERVTKLAWSDKLRDPERVTVTMANQANDITSIIKQISSSGSRNSAGGAKAQEEDHAWIVDTDDHVGLVAEAIVGRDGETVDWSRVSSIIVDGEGIHQRVVKTQDDLVVAESRIEANENNISLEVERAEDAENRLTASIRVTASNIRSEVANSKSALYSKIEQTAGSINLSISNSKSTIFSQIMLTKTSIYTQVGNAKSGLWSAITQSSTQISMKVGKGEVISCINQTAEEIKILAGKINLSGYVTASSLNTVEAKIDNLMSGNTTATLLKANQGNIPKLTVGNDLTFKSHGVYWQSVTINGTSYHLMGYVG